MMITKPIIPVIAEVRGKLPSSMILCWSASRMRVSSSVASFCVGGTARTRS